MKSKFVKIKLNGKKIYIALYHASFRSSLGSFEKFDDSATRTFCVLFMHKTKVGQHFPKVGKKDLHIKIVMTILGNSPLGGVKRILQFYNFYADYIEVYSRLRSQNNIHKT